MDATLKGDKKKEILSLKETCLDFVSRNLSRYSATFCATENADLKGNLEDLRRLYTSYFITKFLEENKRLDKSCFIFLINEYLTELDTHIFHEKDLDAALNRIAEVGHAFQHVKISFPAFCRFERCVNFVPKVVRSTPNVERLEFDGYCNDDTLEIVASSCPKLKELTIWKSDVTNEGLKSLCRHTRIGTGEGGPNLRVLSLRIRSNLDVGVEYLLRNMPSLEEVHYFPLPTILYRMHKDDKKISQTKYNLLSLDMRNYKSYDQIADMLNVITQVCPRIRRLCLVNATGEYLDPITRFSELEDLDIEADDLHTVDCSNLLKCVGGRLRKLEMHQFQISANILIQSCPKVEFLRLTDMTFKPLGHRSAITALYRLGQLSFWYFDFEETLTRQSVTELLKSSPNLRELSFDSCTFPNPRIITDLMTSCESTSLRSLEFRYCDIDEATLKKALSTRLDLENVCLAVKNRMLRS